MKKLIAIVGGGLGGLLLARVLYLNGFGVLVYESEGSPQSRAQGGQLDMHAHNGQVALRIAGLTDQFHAIIHKGAEAARILSDQGELLFEQPDDGEGGRPEVLRGHLRGILRESLPEGTIHWGKKLISAASLGGGRHRLTFADGTTVETEILVGADGAFSKVRKLLSDAKPQYVGTVYIETFLYDVDARHSAVAATVGPGAMFACAPDQCLTAHREAGNVIHAYIQLRRPLEWVRTIDFDDPTIAKARIAAEFRGWAPSLTALITESDTSPVLRPIHSLPDAHRWDRVPGVTLIGDAAHLMPPAGEGANLALLDAAELGLAIAEHPQDIEEAFAVYEARMFPRSQAEAIDAHKLVDICLGAEAPNGLVEFFRSVGQHGDT